MILILPSTFGLKAENIKHAFFLTRIVHKNSEVAVLINLFVEGNSPSGGIFFKNLEGAYFFKKIFIF